MNDVNRAMGDNIELRSILYRLMRALEERIEGDISAFMREAVNLIPHMDLLVLLSVAKYGTREEVASLLPSIAAASIRQLICNIVDLPTQSWAVPDIIQIILHRLPSHERQIIQTMVRNAIWNNNISVLQLLFAHTAIQGQERLFSLRSAIYFGQLPSVRFLLAVGPMEDRFALLTLALEERQFALAGYILTRPPTMHELKDTIGILTGILTRPRTMDELEDTIGCFLAVSMRIFICYLVIKELWSWMPTSDPMMNLVPAGANTGVIP